MKFSFFPIKSPLTDLQSREANPELPCGCFRTTVGESDTAIICVSSKFESMKMSYYLVLGRGKLHCMVLCGQLCYPNKSVSTSIFLFGKFV